MILIGEGQLPRFEARLAEIRMMTASLAGQSQPCEAINLAAVTPELLEKRIRMLAESAEMAADGHRAA